MSLTVATDYLTGDVRLAQDQYTTPSVTAAIERYEPGYLLKLMGKELYDLFIADLDSGDPQEPQAARFTAIYEPFTVWDSTCLKNRVSRGMVDMLKNFMYKEVMAGQQVQNTVNGDVENQSEAADRNRNKAILQAERRVNEAVATYQAIQYKLKSDPDTYPEFENYVEMEPTYLGGI